MGAELVLLILLPLSFVSGWVLARKRIRHDDAQRSISADYLRGLNHLVNEEPDQAIEVFVKLLEVDNETAEVHLALGNLFRRQGEVDRALRIHQNLVARPNLKPQHRNQACYELGQDYLRAGMLDRAESLFSGLVEQGIFGARALAGLVTIYEQGRDWAQAIETSRKLESVLGQSLRPTIAHYLCELAEVERRRRNLARAQELLRQALSEHPGCVRASLMQGQLFEAAKDHAAAIEAYQRVIRQDVAFVSEILEPLERCYSERQDIAGLRGVLEDLNRRSSSIAPRITLTRLLMREGRDRAALDYLNAALRAQPNWQGFHYLLTLMEQISPQAEAGATRPEGALEGLRATLRRMLDVSARYRCHHCGFDGRTLHWQCPRCRQWSSVSPLPDLVLASQESQAVLRPRLRVVNG